MMQEVNEQGAGSYGTEYSTSELTPQADPSKTDLGNSYSKNWDDNSAKKVQTVSGGSNESLA